MLLCSQAFKGPVMSIPQPHFYRIPSPHDPLLSSGPLPPPPSPISPFSLSSCEPAVVPSSPLRSPPPPHHPLDGPGLPHAARSSMEINNILSTLSQFSINDFEVRLSRHIHHIASDQPAKHPIRRELVRQESYTHTLGQTTTKNKCS